MKKILPLMIVLSALMLTYAACQPAAAPTAAPAAEQPTQPAKVGEGVPATKMPAQPASVVEAVQALPQGSAAILILDDFVAETNMDGDIKSYYSAAETYGVKNPPGNTNNCVYTTDGQAAFIAKGASAFIRKGAGNDIGLNVPHGELVYEELKAVIARSGLQEIQIDQANANLLNSESSIKHFAVYQRGQQQLLILAVDTSNYNTYDTAVNLDQTVQLLNQLAVTRIVINMSFVIMPCPDISGNQNAQTLEEYKKFLDTYYPSATENILKWVDSVLSQATSEREKALLLAFDPRFGWLRLPSYYQPPNPFNTKDDFRIYFDRVLNDPIRTKITEYPHTYEVIPVGAAGNYGLKYPFAPAMWNEVLSVGAPPYVDPANNNNQYVFNTGEVVAEGCTTYITRPQDQASVPAPTPTPPVGEKVQVGGTSFAAPKVSFLAALYLLDGAKGGCLTNANITPVLGYANEDLTWSNQDLPTAAGNYCPAFPTPTANQDSSCP